MRGAARLAVTSLFMIYTLGYRALLTLGVDVRCLIRALVHGSKMRCRVSLVLAVGLGLTAFASVLVE